MASAGTAGRGPAPLRLTRRARIVVGVLIALLLSMVVVAVVALAAPPSGAAGPGRKAVVKSGDTLWLIAVREVPDRDPYQAIDEIRRLNGIDGYTIHPGDELRLPASR